MIKTNIAKGGNSVIVIKVTRIVIYVLVFSSQRLEIIRHGCIVDGSIFRNKNEIDCEDRI